MNDPTVPQTVPFPELFDRPLVGAFDQAHASSDGGVILLKAADRAVGLIAALAQALPDSRAATRVTHAWPDVLAQRIFGIACGYPDANDADGLADDPIQKLLLDRDPITGRRLASQPTVSRFENAVRPRCCARATPRRPSGSQGLLRRLFPRCGRPSHAPAFGCASTGGFATPALFDELEAAGVEYVVAMANNTVLEAAAAPLLAEGRIQAEATGTSARVVFDRFHIMRDMTNAVDTVRKAEHRSFLREDGDSPLTRSEYLWLFSEERLPARHAEAFASLRTANLKVARAWALKEALRTLWTYRRRPAVERFFSRWSSWAMSSNDNSMEAGIFSGGIEPLPPTARELSTLVPPRERCCTASFPLMKGAHETHIPLGEHPQPAVVVALAAVIGETGETPTPTAPQGGGLRRRGQSSASPGAAVAAEKDAAMPPDSVSSYLECDKVTTRPAA